MHPLLVVVVGAALIKSLAADFTSVRLLPCVDHHMTLEVVFVVERLGAERTHKWAQ